MAGKKRMRFVTVRALERLDENCCVRYSGQFPEYLATRN